MWFLVSSLMTPTPLALTIWTPPSVSFRLSARSLHLPSCHVPPSILSLTLRRLQRTPPPPMPTAAAVPCNAPLANYQSDILSIAPGIASLHLLSQATNEPFRWFPGATWPARQRVRARWKPKINLISFQNDLNQAVSRTERTLGGFYIRTPREHSLTFNKSLATAWLTCD